MSYGYFSPIAISASDSCPDALGMGLGKTNYCLKALVAKGLVKPRNFRRREDKRAYPHLLTPEGVVAKAALTASFLKRRMVEYDLLRKEIKALCVEVACAETKNSSTRERCP